MSLKSLSKENPIVVFGLALAVVLVIAFIVIPFIPSGELVLQDVETGEIYRRFSVGKNGSFSVTFIDSASKTPYTDYYEVNSEGIFATGSKYYDFGSGVPVRAQGSETLEYAEDGAVVIKGFSRKIDKLVYLIGSSADHVLGFKGEKHGLTHICDGGNKLVEFKMK